MAEQANSKSNVQDRLSVLRQLIRSSESSTQDELCKELRTKKFDVTQSTVSRDLRRIGAVKMTNAEGEVMYRLPEDHQPLPPHLSHDLGGLITSMQANESMIVLHTTPGSASLVARHIDSLRSTIGILGTIAGDDTIFVVPASVRNITAAIQKIKEEF
ncbi:MAG: arginine repressor [Bdellovibrionales bacterium RBG_16_40_8]|nr:MAG: arginine repressor [Bdellovibrionales bacterium RBG_16_40_8]